MKVTLDLGALVAGGQLTAAEAEKLQRLASSETGSFGVNIFLAFGIVAVALGVGVLVPTPQTAIVLGGLAMGLGIALSVAKLARWALFAQIATVTGALAILGGVYVLSDGSLWINLALTGGLSVAAVVAGSGLLAALAVLMLSVALGSGTAYWHASYFVGVERPALTIAVLCAVILALYLVSLRLPPKLERLAIIAMRTAILMVNVAFLVGSLFGDSLLGMPAMVFTIGWAIALLAFGIWAIFANRPWVVNTVAVFGAIHFYTQWFETLGPQPLSIVGGGLLLIGFGLALARFNRWIASKRVDGPISVG